MKKTIARILGLAVGLSLVALGWSYAQPIFSNNLFLLGGNAGVTPQIQAVGTDPNISINLVPKGTGTVQVNGSAIAGGTGVPGNFTVGGNLAVTGTTQLTGSASTQVGTSGTFKLDGALALFHSFAQVATVGTGEETAYTFSLPGNSLVTDGSYLNIKAWSTAGAAGTNKQVRVKFGATTISDSTAANFASGALLYVDCTVMRTGAATQRAYCYGNDGVSGALTGGASANFWKGLTTPGETLSGAVAILVTQQSATAANQTANGAIITWYPNGQ
jgi:hypothetical protein